MRPTCLLDANALIALAVTDHEHHARAATWSASVERFAVCPIVEGSLVRFLVRVGESQGTAMTILTALHASPRCEFWEDSLSYASADLGHVIGHRQVTDAYLAALARSRGGALASFDRALAATLPEIVELIP
ncbi:TA system VapC family ribonuclease toxin [Nocardioides acrostichi]|uniref:Ribonuclease VapC n=1 Tax=Nocardioides acrostichi TaxID=2784339 RepID=A0A930V4G1_9ACTN|nr:TA system VapC family ribonuclease toxin [Nocardioides acrostichi]MBF4163024.1 PIN domain-containing protein [Nocardioides acrostichi]